MSLLKDFFLRSGINGFLVMNEFNVLYFTGFRVEHGRGRLLIPMDGEAAFYVYGVDYEAAKVEAKNCYVEVIKRGEDANRKIVERIMQLNIKSIGFDSLNSITYFKLNRALRGFCKLKPKPKLTWKLRIIKDEDELLLMRKAAEITSEGMKAAYDVLKPGMKEYEVAAEIEYAMRKRGSWGTSFETIVASGLRSAFPHGWCTDRKIEEGDLVVIDVGATYRFYRADMTRTLVAGEPSKKQELMLQEVVKAQEAAVKSAIAGAKAKEVDASAREVIKRAGLEEYFVHGLGHGIGLEVHEPPALSPESKDRLKAGNVITIEPGVYVVGFGGIRVEDVVLIRKKGAELLTHGPYALRIQT